MTRTGRCAVAVGVAATMVWAAVAWSASPVGAQTASCPVSAQDQAIDAEEQALLGLINQYRQANGKNALVMHSDVTRAAAWFSRDMAAIDYFPYDHVDSNGRSLDRRLTWCGVAYSNWAENIYAGSPAAQAVFDAWRASSSHNVNMLREGVTSAGIARAYGDGSTYGWYWTLDLTNTAGAPTTTTSPAPTTTTTTTSTAPPTTAPPTTAGPVPGGADWFAQWFPQYFASTPTTRPVTTTTTTEPPLPTTTTTTIAPPDTTTTTGPADEPAPGTPEWYLQLYARYFDPETALSGDATTE